MNTTRAAALLAVILGLLATAYPLGPTVVGILATIAGVAVCVALGSTLAKKKGTREEL
ncbi:hypothetical protein [Corynebacterium suedekumii]|uniref:Secreted protein n=1 Tax=Corynebacterium suedekumii TaxID=3049801 RepID=A0ABY8VIB3_9CORY|nr:hypothetical protein [Corynebacterium suedekumii]WIM69421.1 hypothetical protein QP029_09170 [Corynebacterium suedekumii]